MTKSGTGRRELTPNEKLVAARLKAIFQHRQETEGLTQVKLGEMIGRSQSGVGQYLNGDIPLNLPAMITFAIALNCRVQDIDPDCPHHILTTPEEKALTAAYWDLKNRGEVASQKALLQVAELSPAYRVTLERTQHTNDADTDPSIEKR